MRKRIEVTRVEQKDFLSKEEGLPCEFLSHTYDFLDFLISRTVALFSCVHFSNYLPKMTWDREKLLTHCWWKLWRFNLWWEGFLPTCLTPSVSHVVTWLYPQLACRRTFFDNGTDVYVALPSLPPQCIWQCNPVQFITTCHWKWIASLL